MAAIDCPERFDCKRFVRLQIVERNGAVIRGHVGRDALRGFAFVELTPASLLNARDRGGKLGLGDGFSLLNGLTPAKKYFCSLRELLHHRDLQTEDDLHALRRWKAFSGERSRG